MKIFNWKFGFKKIVYFVNNQFVNQKRFTAGGGSIPQINILGLLDWFLKTEPISIELENIIRGIFIYIIRTTKYNSIL